MATKTVVIPEIGEVYLAKRKGARYIRLSVTAAGRIRVGLPAWAPYAVGIAFAKNKSEWIKQQTKVHSSSIVGLNGRVGKSHRIVFYDKKSKAGVSIKVTATTIEVASQLPFSDAKVQARLKTACERALKLEAKTLLPQRLKYLANFHGYQYKEVRVRKMTSRWGSCSSAGVITLSYFLIQLPWTLIDYVLLHELIHTEHPNHGQGFWAAFLKALPQAKELRKEIRASRPTLILVQEPNLLAKGVDLS